MVAEGNVGLAFGLVAAAGMATTIGAAFVLLGNVCKPRFLAAALGFAAGVMLYVSFVEIFTAKAVTAFVDAGSSPNAAMRFATFCFFGGVLLVYILDGIVHGITHLAISMKRKELKRLPSVQNLKRLLSKRSRKAPKTLPLEVPTPPAQSDVEAGPVAAAEPPSAADDVVIVNNPLVAPADVRPATDIEAGAAGGGAGVQADASVQAPEQPHHGAVARLEHALHVVEEALSPIHPIAPSDEMTSASGEEQGQTMPIPRDPDVMKILLEDHHQFALMKMGMLTALAIFIHNFPEGLATFVATLADPTIGITIAIAIAIHNVPEGICVALPIYYATGSKWKGFFWGVVSGVSEPLGALFGYLILFDTSPVVYAVVFGLVGGMMVCISLKELIPTALKYDPGARLVVLSIFAGMLVMAASLILFAL